MGRQRTTMAKGAMGGRAPGGKTYACGSKGCYIGILVVGLILLIVGIVLIAQAATIWGDKKDTSTMSASDVIWCEAHHTINGGNACDQCSDDDFGDSLLDRCCTKTVSCSEVVGQWAAGIALAVIGLILALIATCGVCMCCCFVRKAPPPLPSRREASLASLNCGRGVLLRLLRPRQTRGDDQYHTANRGGPQHPASCRRRRYDFYVNLDLA